MLCKNTQIQHSFNLQGKVAIVTGGAGLLGREYVRALLEHGANVLVADIVAFPLSSIANLDIDERQLVDLQMNITDKASVEAMVNAALDQWGKVDILVNNAAIDPKFDADVTDRQANTFEDYPLDLWNQSLAVNLTGAFLCAQAVGKIMVKQDYGVIVNIASTYGLVGPDQRLYKSEGEEEQRLFKPVSYCVTKGGIIQLTRYLATYWAGRNIRVNTLTPGGVYNKQGDEFVKRYAARTPLGRMADKSELCAALLFLVSDASSYMTGANLVVDGGWTAW